MLKRLTNESYERNHNKQNAGTNQQTLKNVKSFQTYGSSPIVTITANRAVGASRTAP